MLERTKDGLLIAGYLEGYPFMDDLRPGDEVAWLQGCGRLTGTITAIYRGVGAGRVTRIDTTTGGNVLGHDLSGVRVYWMGGPACPAGPRSVAILGAR